jgi:hypothetical protein
MPLDSVIDQAIEEIADGRPVDWPALDSGAKNAEEREWLHCLRILDEIAEVHRTGDGKAKTSTVDGDGTTHVSDLRHIGHDPAKVVTDESSQTWGRYRLIAPVGEGSFGRVYRAWDPELEREIAIKILHAQVVDTRLRERLLREGRALAKIRHPNVVSVFGVESHGDRVGLCMEFVSGETLDQALRDKGPLNAREAVLVGEDLCRALAAVHAAGFVHRDVKARNVMRERAGRVVLMDFGTGRQADEVRSSGHPDIAGTPLYMPPEVLAGLPASAAGDVYGVGVLLYHLVTGEYPVEGRSMEELRAAHMQGRRRLLSDRRSDLPTLFVQAVDGALAPDPGRRYSSAGALLQALAAVSGTRRTGWRYVVASVLAVIGVAAVATILGFVASRAFNTNLGRLDFADETPYTWLTWGLRSCIAPTVLALLILLVLAVLMVLKNLILSMSPHARRIDENVRHKLDRASRRLHLDHVSVLASWVLLTSAALLIASWWYFSPVLGSVFSWSSTASVGDLAFLSPAFERYQDLCSQVFSAIAVLSVMAWFYVIRRARQRLEALPWGMLAGGVVICLLSIATQAASYRLFFQARFEMARWNGSDCYVNGQRGEEVLLFCPGLTPRNRIVRSADGAVERSGTRENIFTKFARAQIEESAGGTSR